MHDDNGVQLTLLSWCTFVVTPLRLMMTSPNGNIFRVTGPLCGEFTGPGEFPTQRPVTRSFDVFFDLRLNKPLSKQPWGWWFETISRSLWRHRNAYDISSKQSIKLLVITHRRWWCSLVNQYVFRFWTKSFPYFSLYCTRVIIWLHDIPYFINAESVIYLQVIEAQWRICASVN